MRPASMGSSRFTQRRSVDFPEPDAPMRQTTSCSASSRSIPRSTSTFSNDLRTPSRTSALAHAHARDLSAPAIARDQPVGEPRQRDGDEEEEDRRDDAGREVEGRRLVDLRLAERLDDAEHADERRVLLQPDEVVQERRHHAAHRLRDDHVAERLARARARASARRRSGSGAPTRSLRGRPRTRTRCRRGSSATVPRRAPTSARRRAGAPGIPNPRR